MRPDGVRSAVIRDRTRSAAANHRIPLTGRGARRRSVRFRSAGSPGAPPSRTQALHSIAARLANISGRTRTVAGCSGVLIIRPAVAATGDRRLPSIARLVAERTGCLSAVSISRDIDRDVADMRRRVCGIANRQCRSRDSDRVRPVLFLPVRDGQVQRRLAVLR